MRSDAAGAARQGTLAALMALAMLAALSLAGCGQKGPLTLTPKAGAKASASNPPPQAAPGAASAPVSR